jgi:microcystin-dependent protein
MRDPFIGEIALFPISFAPSGWADCDGRILAISQYNSLYTLIGTAYGGNGTSNFGLPDLRGRAMVCFGPMQGGEVYVIGRLEGAEAVVLTEETTPQHTHRMGATSVSGQSNDPTGHLLAKAGAGLLAETFQGLIYNTNQPGPGVQLSTNSVAPVGGQLAHNNMQPSLVLRYCIALQGIYPPRSATQAS